MERNFPLVSVIIPCRNEEKFIDQCLRSVISQDYPKEKLEVLAVDGMSDDGTRKIVGEYRKKYPFIKLFDNHEKFIPFAMNIGIRAARGEIIVRMDAHADYAKDYVSRCVVAMEESGADNVGGRVDILPSNNSLMARAIASVLSSFFGAGNAHYKTSLLKKSMEVDTVFCGCYRREVFDKIGLFDERMIRNQDLEFNLRLKRTGGKIILSPKIISYYYSKNSLRGFAGHNFADGFWVIYPLKFGLKTFSWRHLLPMVFVSGIFSLFLLGFWHRFFWIALIAGLAFYVLFNLIFSARMAIREKNTAVFLPITAVFFVRHFFYGLGSLWALLKVCFFKFLL